MEEKLDIRIQRTYAALTETFLQMMREMPFEDIRISELCERSMIRKSTFYKHFGDKSELLAFLIRQELERNNARLEKEAANATPDERCRRLIGMTLDLIEENRELLESAAESESSSRILGLVAEQILPDLQRRLREEARTGTALPAAPEVLASFYFGGLVETVRRSLKKGSCLNTPALKEQLSTLVCRSLRPGAADRFSRPPV